MILGIFLARYFWIWSLGYIGHPFLVLIRALMEILQVIQGIQNGPYKNIYNPENFFVGSQGSGAANNWAAGYAAGDSVKEEVFDMIDREAEGSDSLEVR